VSEGRRALEATARLDFGRARQREIMSRILGLLTIQKDEMLSLPDVRRILRPDSETYQGMQTVPIAKIVGSEGRAHDFNRAFLPRHDKMMRRWVNVDVAHYQNVILPPIKLFEIGGVYFVRDGNHRVSVARLQGAEFIDAEVTSLASDIAIEAGMSREDLIRAVIAFERRRFYAETGLGDARPNADVAFSEIGRYDEAFEHIREHKWYLNQHRSDEIPLAEAAASWYDRVYVPIVEIIRETRLLSRFPRATEGDLYVYIGHHWAELVKTYGPIFTLEEAAEDYSTDSRTPTLLRLARRWGRGLRAWWQSNARRLRIPR
jgi:hypothetical protein